MKYSVIFMVSFVVTFLVLCNVKVEVEAMTKFGCNATRSFPGDCRNNRNYYDGDNLCRRDFHKFPGFPKHVDIRCSCSAEDHKPGWPIARRCECLYDC
ncbi:hypothetical protein Bca4012_018924 [Brassica carinata]